MSYVDGFVLPVPMANLARYKEIATKAREVWLRHGALDYREAAGDDLNIEGMTPFGSAVRTEAGETIVFAWILYRDRAHRDEVNKKVMVDPELSAMCGADSMPFDMTRMLYGGFQVIVE